MAAITEWNPLHSAHAIQQVNVSVIFSQATTDVPWRKIVADGRAVAGALNLRVENPIKTFAVQLGPEPQPHIMQPQDAGVEFGRLSQPNVFVEKLRLERGSIRYENWDYTRWSGTRARLEKILDKVLSYYVNAVPILGVAVEYVDRFDAISIASNPHCSQIVDRQSDLIATRAFQDEAPWHSHVGWFEGADDRVRRLVNCDVDVADLATKTIGGDPDKPRRVIQIRTSFNDYFNQPNFLPTPDDDLSQQNLLDRLDRMHTELKHVLGGILTKPAAERIQLFGRV